MLVRSKNTFVTETRLVGSRWIWADQNGHEFSRSFYFGADGLIKIYQHHNEHSWRLTDGILTILDESGEIFWIFDVVCFAEDSLCLVGRSPQYPNLPWCSLTEYRKATIATPPPTPLAEPPLPVIDEAGDAEGIRLVIWDLDETFWQGTLSEGGITVDRSHIEIIHELNRRGIINAICSKNHFDAVRAELTALALWDEFVFPEIAFMPKGAMVRDIVHNAQLRPETVLFIDDNKMNLNEALHYLPKLNVAEPAIIPTILGDHRFNGKPDPQKSRLKRYKVLEAKLTEKRGAATSNEDFLRQSQIRVSFHTDIEAEFKRIHDLVNRTNQLNFTKNRWPEDPAEALAQFRREASVFGAHCGYVKVADRFGAYGICGFYMFAYGRCSHFLFSCRSMDMGVEQFVWSKLGKPFIQIKGEVASDVDMDVDWISIVDDAESDVASLAANATLKICIRGACDLMMVSQFLRTQTTTIEEFNYPYQGWQISSLPRIFAVAEEVTKPENRNLIRQLAGFPANRFETDILTASADAFVLSFSQESFYGLYRSKSTGIILPMQHLGFGAYDHVKPDYTKIPYDEIIARGIKGISLNQWQFLSEEFEFLGGFNETIFINDITNMIDHLRSRNKTVIILGLNDRIGRAADLMEFFGRINAIVKPVAIKQGCTYIDMADFVTSEADLAADEAKGGAHYARHIYSRIAEKILALVQR